MPEVRIARLRRALGWSQYQMGAFLRVSQPTVWNMENGQAEPGPVSKLLDQLEEALERGEKPEAPAAAESARAS
jgi:transcriptional regulator with XRE-family HTH domain